MPLVRFIQKYAKEYDEAFPTSIELGPPDTLPNEPLSIPGVANVSAPTYYAGFFIDAVFLHYHLKDIGWSPNPISLDFDIGREWRTRGKPEPFVIPKAMPRPSGDYLIWFIHRASPPQFVQKFLTHRDEVLARFCDMMRFTSEEAAFIRGNVKWQRFTHEDRELPPDVILCKESFGGDSTSEEDSE
ncbi:hypothetical protein CC1G_07260 [Coprinopsis cinerea okayama7|uniref:Uncharacterized protein n=1 Tax=Coprinopsis cinerea (strain Okayama-7 / 130 / ATCC MYA-4618 / FGSC 9003) TaxID=240176 RepID=A8PD47_COPC7|nr:hypothetical protein CC1G_07260 [Coprinopsis cinerea okayama7\|eukprot:XP_001840530.1 hypothetical protein CC1G_07260 [Coprinopsis cinerea okayama7\